MGDMNNLLHASDKKGRVPIPNWMLNGFQSAITDCSLIDLDLQGHPYTWRNRLGTSDPVEERLDRALATSGWLHLFPRARLRNLLAPLSDHSPILLECEEKYPVSHAKKFCFENVWFQEPDIDAM